MMRTFTWSWWTMLGVVILVATSCASEPSTQGAAPANTAEPSNTAITAPANTTEQSTEPASTEPASTAVDDSASTTEQSTEPASTAVDDSASTTEPLSDAAGDTTDTPSGSSALPTREGPRERTTESVPHVQLDAAPVPEIDAELRRRAFAIPGVVDEPSVISLAGTRALWISEDIDLARPEILLAGREFAHIHPDGSLHIWLPVERATEVHETAWGELHPWVERDDFWDGVAMVFTPQNQAEVDVTIQLLVEAYNNVSGLDLDPSVY